MSCQNNHRSIPRGLKFQDNNNYPFQKSPESNPAGDQASNTHISSQKHRFLRRRGAHREGGQYNLPSLGNGKRSGLSPDLWRPVRISFGPPWLTPALFGTLPRPHSNTTRQQLRSWGGVSGKCLNAKCYNAKVPKCNVLKC